MLRKIFYIAFLVFFLNIGSANAGMTGSEELKGNETIRQAASMLRDADLPIEFRGFVEGNDIPAGTVDVVVTDGFVGNVALKTAEGVAKLYLEYMRSAFRRGLFSRMGFLLARPALRALRDRIDPRAYNGGTFLGLNGVAVKPSIKLGSILFIALS